LAALICQGWTNGRNRPTPFWNRYALLQTNCVPRAGSMLLPQPDDKKRES
jgi:hypothetical protein